MSDNFFYPGRIFLADSAMEILIENKVLNIILSMMRIGFDVSN